MIHFSSPYSLTGNYFEAINKEFEKISNPNDWLVILDGDTMFLQPDFGHQLQMYADLYPETGLFTCYASRCSYDYQVPSFVDQENPSISYHKMISQKMRELFHDDVLELDTKIAGHLMMIRKSTWMKIKPKVERRIVLKKKEILGVDTQISQTILNCGLKIRLMKGVYILHYFRLLEGRNNDNHLS